MKILGFIMIIASSAVCALSYIEQRKDRLETLMSFISMLELMEAELCQNLCPFPELVGHLSGKVNGKADNFVTLLGINLGFLGEKNFSCIWEESVKACDPMFKKKEYKTFVALSSVLGKYSPEKQSKAINDAIMIFSDSAKLEAMDLPQYKRLSLGLSVSAGALLAILLV